jgi:hypothetical protein
MDTRRGSTGESLGVRAVEQEKDVRIDHGYRHKQLLDTARAEHSTPPSRSPLPEVENGRRVRGERREVSMGPSFARGRWRNTNPVAEDFHVGF